MASRGQRKEAEPQGICGDLLVFFSYFLVFLTFPVTIFFCVKIVQEYERAVIFRLGMLRKGGARGPGLFFILPCIDEYRKVDLRVVAFDVPPQEVLSKDSVTVQVDAISSSMLRWRGSIWKAVLKDLIAFYIAYYIILFFQWGLMDEKQKEYFTGWIKWCEIGTQYIPLSFLLGFFVAVVVARWWEQFNWISWPDKLMMTISTCLPGKENLEVRKTIARWSSLQSAVSWMGISVRTLKRFPTERHLVESKLMTEEEYDLYMSVDAPHGKWFVPLMWILNLLKQQLRERRIDSVQMQMLVEQLFKFRDGFAMLYVYDWVKVPLVYTQVVAIATYGYFFICLIGRQPKLDVKSMEQEITILFPLFTTFQMLFYIGWLKVGQFLMNPFGEDDDDFELNYVLDRNTYIAHMMASELADQLPSKINNEMPVLLLPHTRASFKIQDIIPKGSLSDFQIHPKEMQLIRTDELDLAMRELEEREKRRKVSMPALLKSSRKRDSKLNESVDERKQMMIEEMDERGTTENRPNNTEGKHI